MKSKKKIITMLIIIIVLILIIATAILYFTTDIFKSPKQLFFKYLSKQIGNGKEINYTQMLEQIKENESKSYISNTEMKLNIKMEDDEYFKTDSEYTNESAEELKFTVEQKVNSKEHSSYNRINASMGEKELAEVELVQNNDTYAVKSDYLNEDKYISIENNNLKEFFKKLGMDDDQLQDVPDKITPVDIYSFLYISNEEQKNITDKYKKFLNENLKEDKFEKTKNENIKIDNKEISVNKYEMKLSEKDIINITNNFFETLKKDDMTLDLIIDKYNKYMQDSFLGIGAKEYQLVNDEKNQNSETETLTKDKIIEYIEKMQNDLKSELENASESSVMKIDVYETKGKVYRTEISKDEERIFEIDYYERNDRNYIEMLFPVNKTSDYYRDDYEEDTNNNTKEEKIVIDYVVKTENNATNIEGNIKLVQDEEKNVKFNVTKKGENGKGTNELNVELASTIEEVDLKLNINNKTEYKNDVEIVNLNDNKENIINLNEMSAEEITKLFQEIGESFQQKWNKKIEDLGILGLDENDKEDSEETEEDMNDYGIEIEDDNEENDDAEDDIEDDEQMNYEIE